jgi:hypothetical protein
VTYLTTILLAAALIVCPAAASGMSAPGLDLLLAWEEPGEPPVSPEQPGEVSEPPERPPIDGYEEELLPGEESPPNDEGQVEPSQAPAEDEGGGEAPVEGHQE